MRNKMNIQSVSTIERALADLATKREAIVARATEVADRRKVLGFIALVGNDKTATAELEKLNTEHSAVNGALEGLDGAISEGQRRLVLAKAAEAKIADESEARELAEQLEVFVACGQEIDRALETIVTAPQRMQGALQKMHDLGAPRPDHRQFTTFSRDCLLTALRKTPWGREFPILPVGQRRRFGDLTASWAAGIRSRITPRLATEKAA
jgi:hypothetical protein